MAASDQVYLGTIFTNNDPDTNGVKPGDIVELDTSLDASIKKVQVANSTNVLGVVVVGGAKGTRVTVCGFTGQRIRVNVASSQAVAIGDRLVTDGIVAGRAMVDNGADPGEVFAFAITTKTSGIDDKIECLYTNTGAVTLPSDLVANGYFVVTRSTSAPVNSVNLGALTTGLLKSTVSGAIATLSIGVSGTDFQAPMSAANATITFATATTIKVGTLPNKFIVQGTADATLSGAQFLGALTTGLVKNTTTTGVLSIAAAGTDYQAPLTAADATISFPTATTIKVNQLPSKFIVQGITDTALPNAQFLGALTTGIIKNTTTTGVLSVAVSNTDYAAPDAYYLVSRSTNAPTNAVNLGALTTGLLKQTVSGSIATISIGVAGIDYENPLTFTSPLTRSSNTISIATNGIDNTLIRQGSATSVIGRSANSTGNVADIAATTNGQILFRDTTSALVWGSPPATSINNLFATWSRTGARVYALDGVNGDDANLGYADSADTTQANVAIATAAAGLIAKKTWAALAAIIPPIGNGRTAYVVINNANSATNSTTTYTDRFDAISFASSYAVIGIRATGTNTTAGATAFDGGTADLTYQGAVTATGMNATGYSVNSTATTDSVALTKIGGGSPAFPAETAKPYFVRARFDNATTTSALRNTAYPVVEVIDSQTIRLGKILSVAAGDVVYLEEQGVVFSSTATQQFNQTNTTFAIYGISFGGSLQFTRTSATLVWVQTPTANSITATEGILNILTQTASFVGSPNGTTSSQGPTRTGSVSLIRAAGSIGIRIPNGAFIGGALGTTGNVSITASPNLAGPGSWCAVGGDLGINGGGGAESIYALTGVIGTANTTPGIVGGANTGTAGVEAPLRVLGTMILNSARVTVSSVKLPSTTTAYGLRFVGTNDFWQIDKIYGGTKTDAGVDTSQSHNSRIAYTDGVSAFGLLLTGANGGVHFGQNNGVSIGHIYANVDDMRQSGDNILMPTGDSWSRIIGTGDPSQVSFVGGFSGNIAQFVGNGTGSTITGQRMIRSNTIPGDANNIGTLKADSTTTMDGAIGFLVSDVPAGKGGVAIFSGIVAVPPDSGEITGGFGPGIPVWVSPTDQGKGTHVMPTSPNVARMIGWSLGEVLVQLTPDNFAATPHFASETAPTTIGYVKSVVNSLTLTTSTTIPYTDITGAPAAITALTSDVTATGPGSVAATISANAVTDTKLRQSAGLSVIGRSANSTGNVADITAGTDGDVLRRSGTTLGFGTIPEASVTNLITDLAGKQPTGNYITALTGDVTATGPGSVAATIATHAVSYSKLQQASALTLLGNPTGSTANISEITLGSGLSFSGTTLIATGSGGTVTNVTASLPLASSGGTTPNITINYDTSLALSGSNLQRAALTGDVTAAAGNNTTTIATNAVTDSKLRQGGPLSVIGRSANSTGNVADISATAASDAVLRESGSVIGFGTIATAGITNNAITDAKLRQSAATSVIGRSVNSTGNVADIAASSDGDILRRASGVLGFGAVPESSVTNLVTDLAGKQPTGNYITALTGDGTATGPGSVAFTLASVGPGAGTIGTAGVNSITLDVKGRVTAATTLAWPASGEFLISNGISAAPIGRSGVNYDSVGHSGDGFIELSDSVSLAIYNNGGGSVGNYERVAFEWDSNTFGILSQKGGSGTTVRDLKIDPGTATLILGSSLSGTRLPPLGGFGSALVATDNAGNLFVVNYGGSDTKLIYYIDHLSDSAPLDTSGVWAATSSTSGTITTTVEYPGAFVAGKAQLRVNLISQTGLSNTVTCSITRNGSIISGADVTFLIGTTGNGVIVGSVSSTGSSSANDTYGLFVKAAGPTVGGTAIISAEILLTP